MVVVQALPPLLLTVCVLTLSPVVAGAVAGAGTEVKAEAAVEAAESRDSSERVEEGGLVVVGPGKWASAREAVDHGGGGDRGS